MNNRTALLLVGSPKNVSGSLEKLGLLLLKYIEEQGYRTESIRISKVIREENMDLLIEKVHNVDVFNVSFPLYADSIPALLTIFLEAYKNGKSKNAKLLAIVNSGFPEAVHNNTAVEVMRLFAIQNGFTWAGGFTIGGGGVFSNDDIEKMGMAKNIISSFKKAATYIANGDELPNEVFEMVAKPIMPKSVYTFLGQVGWITQAAKNRSLLKLWEKPYADR